MKTIASTANRSIMGISASMVADLFEPGLEKNMGYDPVVSGVRGEGAFNLLIIVQAAKKPRPIFCELIHT